jgi:hypothetical protein
MENKIDHESFLEYEKKILDPNITGQIRYTVDSSIQSSVKYDYLCEKFGKEKVDEVFISMDINFLALDKHEIFSRVKLELQK